MNEVSLVLKSVTILISALKDAQKTSTAKSELLDGVRNSYTAVWL